MSTVMSSRPPRLNVEDVFGWLLFLSGIIACVCAMAVIVALTLALILWLFPGGS